MTPFCAILFGVIKASSTKTHETKPLINGRRILWTGKDNFHPEILMKITKSSHLLSPGHFDRLSPNYPWSLSIKGKFLANPPAVHILHACICFHTTFTIPFLLYDLRYWLEHQTSFAETTSSQNFFDRYSHRCLPSSLLRNLSIF